MGSEKKYWNSLEQLNNDEAFLETAEKEFQEEIPVEEFLGKTELDQVTTNRRDFLKFVGFSVGAATLAACEAPVTKSIPYVVKPEEVYPGVANWYASTYCDGNDFANILVKTREGRPIFIKGNKNSKVTNGDINARISASVLDLYDSHRFKTPRKGETIISWPDVDKAIIDGLAKAKDDNKLVYLVTNGTPSPSTWATIRKFEEAHTGEMNEYNENGDIVGVANVSRVRTISYSAIAKDAVKLAHDWNFGKGVMPTYNVDKAKVIVSIGSDFLGGSGCTLNASDYTSRRNPDGDWMSRHFQFEANMSLTGANADVRGAIKPSEYGKALVNVYNAIAAKSGGSKISGGGDLDNDNMANDKLAKAVGELLSNKGASLVLCGSNDVNHQILVNEINQMLGNYGTTVDINRKSKLNGGSSTQIQDMIKDIKSGNVGAVIFYGTNPAYSAPASLKFAEALSKVPLKVSLSDRPNETTVLCDFVAPDSHWLESWNDYKAVRGEYSLSQPVIKPLFKSRQAQSSLLKWAGEENTDYYQFLTKNWEENMFTKQTGETYFKAFWNKVLHDGMFSVAAEPKEWTFTSKASDAGSAVSKEKGGTWEAILYSSVAIGDGSAANNPHLQEMPDPVSRISWDNYIAMNPSDMTEAGFETRTAQETPASTAKVTVEGQELVLPVIAQPGQKKKTVAIAVGYGRQNAGKAATGLGGNAYPMMRVDGTIQNTSSNVSIEGTGETYEVASVQTHHTMMGRKIVNETDITTYKNVDRNDEAKGWNKDMKLSNAYGEKTHVKKLDLWESHDDIKRGHLWGMSIDLNACTGCGACVTSCHINNNVPVVGKDEIRRTRSMFWLRIDRYYSSDADPKKNNGEKNYEAMENPSDYPDAVFQPVMCQHCNHAPCETVCPVAATTHSNEGFNQMAYNRCVGTRYCANNCPYKVRRFNWFNYNKDSLFTSVNPAQNELSRMVLNPDVVVRSRGVMEKCSLCVQDVQAGKLQAKKEGRKVRDGEIQTACSAACAAGAIVFGDLNDKTRVAERAEHDRSYYLLEEVGTRPNISYMTKVRNRKAEV